MAKSSELNNLRINYRQAVKTLEGTKQKLISKINKNNYSIMGEVESYLSQVEALVHIQDIMTDALKEEKD